jgi:hypothetical protein
MKYYVESRTRRISYIKKGKANWTGHIWRRNCLLNTLLKKREKEGWKLGENEEEYVSSYWMTRFFMNKNCLLIPRKSHAEIQGSAEQI